MSFLFLFIFEGLLWYLFVSSSDILIFCQSNSEDDSKIYYDDFKCFMDVYLFEVIQVQWEEIVISMEEMDLVECCFKEENFMDIQYINFQIFFLK